MKYTCSQGQCWDSVAYEAYKDEFLFPYVMDANRQYSDVVVFEGGEVLDIPQIILTDNSIVARPFQNSAIRILKAPWE